MNRPGLALSSVLLLLGTVEAQSQRAAGPPGMLDYLHDGWYFNGAARADAQARTHGVAAGTAFAIDCNGTAPRILLDFRSSPPGVGLGDQATATRPARVTFTFTRHSFAAAVTSKFDTEQKRSIAAKLLTRGAVGGPDVSERIVIDGADAMEIIGQLKSMDQVSAQVTELGQPVSFALTDAKAAIDQLLAVCSSGQ